MQEQSVKTSSKQTSATPLPVAGLLKSRSWGDTVQRTDAFDQGVEERGFLQPRPFSQSSDASIASNHPGNLAQLQRQLDVTKSNGFNFGQLSVEPVARIPIQTKLTVGSPGDKYEQEADQVADRVMDKLDAPAPSNAESGQAVQRQDVGEDEEQVNTKPLADTIQRQGGEAPGMAAPTIESAIKEKRGGGQPLENSLRRNMEGAFGADFSGVRVHTDSKSDMLNRSLQAKAFTTGQDIHFKQANYDPGSKEGQKLIAHELTHVIQQNGGKIQPKWENKTIQRSSQSPTITPASPSVIQREPAEPQAGDVNPENLKNVGAAIEQSMQQAIGITGQEKNKNVQALSTYEEADNDIKANLVGKTNEAGDFAKQIDEKVSSASGEGEKENGSKGKQNTEQGPSEADKQKVKDADKQLAEAEAKAGLPQGKVEGLDATPPNNASANRAAGSPASSLFSRLAKKLWKSKTRINRKAEPGVQAVKPKLLTQGPVVQRFFKKLWSGAKSLGSKVWSGIKAAASWAWNKLKSAFNFIWQRIKKLVAKVKEKVGGVVQKVRSIFSPVQQLSQAIASTKAEIPGQIKSKDDTITGLTQATEMAKQLTAFKGSQDSGETATINRKADDSQAQAATQSPVNKEPGWFEKGGMNEELADGPKNLGGKIALGALEAVAAPLSPRFWASAVEEYKGIWGLSSEQAKLLYGEGTIGTVFRVVDTAAVTAKQVATITGSIGTLLAIIGGITSLTGVGLPVGAACLAAAGILAKITLVAGALAAALKFAVAGRQYKLSRDYPPGSREREILSQKWKANAVDGVMNAVTAGLSYGGGFAGGFAKSAKAAKLAKETSKAALKDGLSKSAARDAGKMVFKNQIKRGGGEATKGIFGKVASTFKGFGKYLKGKGYARIGGGIRKGGKLLSEATRKAGAGGYVVDSTFLKPLLKEGGKAVVGSETKEQARGKEEKLIQEALRSSELRAMIKEHKKLDKNSIIDAEELGVFAQEERTQKIKDAKQKVSEFLEKFRKVGVKGLSPEERKKLMIILRMRSFENEKDEDKLVELFSEQNSQNPQNEGGQNSNEDDHLKWQKASSAYEQLSKKEKPSIADYREMARLSNYIKELERKNKK